VRVHIYDLGENVSVLNGVGRVFGTGAFHAGVEVYGREWSFCPRPCGPSGTGVFSCFPKRNPAYVYRETLDMGWTSLSRNEVSVLVDNLAQEWHCMRYDLFRQNCCHFANEMCKRLGFDDLPSWVTSLAGAGATLDEAVGKGSLKNLVVGVGETGGGMVESTITTLVSPIALVSSACVLAVDSVFDLAMCCTTSNTRKGAY